MEITGKFDKLKHTFSRKTLNSVKNLFVSFFVRHAALAKVYVTGGVFFTLKRLPMFYPELEVFKTLTRSAARSAIFWEIPGLMKMKKKTLSLHIACSIIKELRAYKYHL